METSPFSITDLLLKSVLNPKQKTNLKNKAGGLRLRFVDKAKEELSHRKARCGRLSSVRGTRGRGDREESVGRGNNSPLPEPPIQLNCISPTTRQ